MTAASNVLSRTSDDKVNLFTPFLGESKAHIVELGARLNVPFKLTWSCYKGGELHCGVCGTCIERIEAFRLAEIKDSTLYEKEVHR